MTRVDLPTFVSEAVEELVLCVATQLASCPGDGAAFEASEANICRALAKVGQGAMQALLESADPKGRDLEINGVRQWEAVRAAREYMTAFGAVRVERGIYRSIRNGPTVCPMELRAGIVEHFWTRRAAKVAVTALADLTSYRAAELFSELGGMQPSRSSLDRLPRKLSRRWEANREAFEQVVREADDIPMEAVAVAVSLDGVMTPTRGTSRQEKKARTRASGRPDKGPAGYREAACGALSFYDRKGDRLKTIRFGRMPEPKMATLQQTLRAELAHVRALRPELRVVAVADGDPVLWDFLDSLKPDVSVVDFFHAAEHLKRALDLTETPSAVATQQRFSKLRRCLKHQPHGVKTVLRSLCQKQPRRTGPAALYRRGDTYFRRHAHRMNYFAVSRRKLPIGSGVIEGTCRWLVSDRLKRTGMRWGIPGGQAILTLRALVHSNRLSSAWPLLTGQASRV